MSIYNRKMFNRNARNALNRTAGIPNVAMFHAGGPVGHTHQGNILQRFINAPNTISGVVNSLSGSNPQTPVGSIQRVGGNTNPLNMSPIEAAALREYRAKQSPQPNIGSLLTLRGGASGVVSDAVGPRSSKLGTRLLQDAATYGTNVFVDAPMAAGAGLASLFARRKDKGAGTVGAPMRLAGGVVDQINTGKLPEDLSGVDITTIPGVGVGTPPPVPAGTAPGTPIKIGAPGDKTRQPPTDPFSPQFPIAFGQPVTDMAQIATADAGMQTDAAPMGRLQDEETRKRILAEETRMQQGQTTPTPTESEEDRQKRILAEETRMQQGQISPLDENEEPSIEIKTKEEIEDVINSGDPKTQQDQLRQLMKEFTQNAPQYDGVDKGLAMAKIGFAMAAGKSPRAIENIASAMEQGADMLIKDKAKKDEFNRQVQLSALQYGIGEISKERAQARLDERSFENFVNDSDKTITYKGVEYAPGRSIRISNADYLANGGKLPPELATEKVYTSNQSAIIARAKANADIRQKAYEARRMTVKDQTKYREDYSALVDQASQAETAGTLIESVIRRSGKAVGGAAAVKQAGANFLGIFNLEAPEGWNDQKLAVQDLKAALQSVVPATLGKTQSANSISNRDVDLLIQGFLADGIMTANGDGTFAFAMTTQETFVNSLQNGLRAVRQSQAEALRNMTAIDTELLELYTPSGKVGTAITDPLRAQGIFTPGGTAKEGVSIQSMVQADDGIFDINPEFFG
tara:strand:+ start:1052 stop:3286 length:2235 start_codon:yes stop_codon:yes gene_type:complete